jgi:hypothetical protein
MLSIETANLTQILGGGFHSVDAYGAMRMKVDEAG